VDWSTIACVQLLGTCPTDMNDEYNRASGSANAGNSFLNMSEGRPSGPPDLLGLSFL